MAKDALATDWIVDINDTGSDPMPVGGTIIYNITVANEDLPSSIAPATVLTLTIPASAVFTGGTGTITGCTPIPGTGPTTVTCTVPPLPGEGEATLQAQVLTSMTGTIGVTASVPTSVVTGNVTVNDTAPGNNSATQQTTVTSAADLELSVAGPASAASGSLVSYVFTAENLGPDTASDVTIDVPKPTGLDNIELPPGCSLSGSNYTCTIPGPILNGGSAAVTFIGQISTVADSTVTVAATITGSMPGDPRPDNNKALISTAVNAGSDVMITKSRAPAGSLVINDQVTFTLSASYTGESPSGLTITDVLPGNYAIDTVTPSANSGWTCVVSGQEVICSRSQGDQAGANVPLGNITIVATVVQGGNATNDVTITSDGPLDPNPDNNTANDGSVTINEESSDLRANKSGPSDPPLVVVGQSYPFRLSTTNLGNRPFSGTLIMTDDLPAGLLVTSYAENGWSCSPDPVVQFPQQLVCTLEYTEENPLGVGDTSPAVVLTAEVTGPGSIANSMTVSSENPKFPDPDLGNNTDTTEAGSTGQGEAADIRVFKTAEKPQVAAGEEQSFDIEIVNAGPSASANVQLTDTLTNLIDNVAGSGLVSFAADPANDSNFTCSLTPVGGTGGRSGQLTCTLTTLPVCDQGVDCPKVKVTVRPGGNAGSRTNTARAISTTVGDPNLANNTGTAEYEVLPRADVTLDKRATPTRVPAGQPLTFIITAKTTEDGRSDADDVTIKDVLPPGLVFVSATPSSGTCSQPDEGSITTGSETVECNLGTVPNGGQQTVTILVRPTTQTRRTFFTNTAAVTTSTQGDDTGNNSDGVDVEVLNPSLDLQINKSDEPNVVSVDQIVVFTLTAKNNGPSDAENVVIRDDLPVAGNLIYESFSAPDDARCAITPVNTLPVTTLECSFPRLTAGETRVVTISMRGERKGNVDNTVQVSSTETELGFDSNMRNNRDSEQTTVRNRVDLRITKDTTTPAVELRQSFTFDITLENLTGTRLGEADDVVVRDNLPSGMVLTGTPVATAAPGVASLNQCQGASGATSFTCSFGTVVTDGVITISVPVRVTSVNQSPRILTNTARVETSSLDIDAANNSDPAAVTVTSSAVSGIVYRDFNANASQDVGDTGITGITINLTGMASIDGASITRNTTTNASGAFTFNFLPAGAYTVTRGAVNEASLTAGVAIPGTGGGTASGATIVSAINATIASPASANNFTLIPQSSIAVVKELESVIVNADGTFDATFKLIVTNPSLESLTAITLTDPLAGPAPGFGTHVQGSPGENQYTISAAPSGTCGGLNSGFDGDSDTSAASGFSLAANASCNVLFTLRANPEQNNTIYTNQAEVSGTGSLSGQAPEDTSNEVSLTAEFDISINLQKSVGTLPATSTVKPGDPIQYTFTVTNTGEVRLTGIVVADPLVPNITCEETTLDPGQSTDCTGDDYLLTVNDIIAGKVDNTAEASGQPPRGSPVNDDAFSTTPLPLFALLALEKGYTGFTDNDGSGAVSLGDTLNYTITATNTGTLTQTGVDVRDDRITPSSITCATLAPGASCTLTGSLTVSEADVVNGEVVNEATAKSNEAEEQKDSTTTPVPGTDMEVVSKTASPESVALGAEFNFTIILRNNAGEDPLNPGESLVDAAAVTLTDNLPDGMVLAGGASATVDAGTASQNACTGALGETSFTCDFGLVSTGAEITVTVPVRVTSISTSPGTLTNEASVSTATRDVKPDNNANTGDVTVAAAGLSGKVYRDFLNNGAQDAGDTGIEGIEITLAGTAQDGSAISLTTMTDAAGSYFFGDLPVGTYTITRGAVSEAHLTGGQAIPGTAGGVVESAEVVGTISIGDDQAATGYDFTLVPQARIGVAKRVSAGPAANDNGTLDVTFELLVANLSLEGMTGISVEDVLQGEAPSFGTYAQTLAAPGSYTVTRAPSGSCGGLNTSYNGASSATLASGFSLAANATCAISVTISVLPTDPPPTLRADGAAYLNQANVSGTGELSQQEADDLSDDGDNPDSNGNGIGNEDGENDPTPVGCPIAEPRLLNLENEPSTGEDADGGNDPTPVACPILDPPKLSLKKELSKHEDVDGNGVISPRDILHYVITAENPGPFVLENVVVTDNLISPNRQECPVLNVNESCVLEGTLTVTIDDAQAGEIMNTATATSRQTAPRQSSITVEVKPAGDGNNITKRALVSTAKRGERVPYVITAEDVPLDPARIVDIMPPGFTYLKGSARANGTRVEPEVDGRNLTFDGLVPDDGNDIKLELTLVVTSGASTGDAVNQAQLVDPDTGEVLGTARARVTIMEEAVFDCSDVIGKVFDDKNRDGYQDEGEPGLPGVRLATVKGLLVTTDPHGRFSIACADIPDEDIGSNFIVKLDTRTLPTGYRVTTENPRKVRLTRGKVVKLNFGASLTRLVSLDLNARVFEDGSSMLKPKWQAGLGQLITALGAEQSTLRISYAGTDRALAKVRLRAITREIERRWKEEGRPYRLPIETRIVSPGEEAGQ